MLNEQHFHWVIIYFLNVLMTDYTSRHMRSCVRADEQASACRRNWSHACQQMHFSSIWQHVRLTRVNETDVVNTSPLLLFQRFMHSQNKTLFFSSLRRCSSLFSLIDSLWPPLVAPKSHEDPLQSPSVGLDHKSQQRLVYIFI